jgi:hypothetical protein
MLVVLLAAAASSSTAWTGPVRWTDPDSLFYQAQSLEIRGQSQRAALEHVFNGPLARQARAWDVNRRYASNPTWVAYSSRFYRRRWVVPALAAALAPGLGDRSLEIVSLLAYLLIGPLLYRLIRHRFSPSISAAAAAACLWLPPLRWYSLRPMADSWGLALLLAALTAAMLVAEQGQRWLPVWLVTMVALALTKEDFVVAILAVAWLALRTRTKRPLLLAFTGVAATLPVALLLGASLRETLAYTENNFQRPADPSWRFVLGHYIAAVRSTVHDDLLLPRLSRWGTPLTLLWYLGCAIVAAGLFLLLTRDGLDPFFLLMQGSFLGGLAFMALSSNYSGFRLELVFVPAVAVGFASLLKATAPPLTAQRHRLHWPALPTITHIRLR